MTLDGVVVPTMDIDGIAFDAFGTLFDLGELEERFKSVVVPWTWHVTASGRFQPLPKIAEAAGIDPEPLKSLPAYDGVAEGLNTLRGTPLAVLSNGTLEGVTALTENAGLRARFQHLLAADQVERYKPAPEIYALAADAFGCEPGRVLLVSGNEWDVTGAARFGLRTAWLARDREPSWVLGVEPDLVVQRIADLA
jgi:HAD superfamily hydrolase (TIGR01509 family)